MPPWAWGLLLTSIGLIAGLVTAVLKVGLAAGKLAAQLDATQALVKDLREQMKELREMIRLLNERITYLESASASPRPIRLATPPFGTPAAGNGESP